MMPSLDQDEKFLSAKARARTINFSRSLLPTVRVLPPHGKTESLQVLAEGFSRAGIPVFAADVKGDRSGVAARGDERPEFVSRAKGMGLDYAPEEFPIVFLGFVCRRPIRAAVFEAGPLRVSWAARRRKSPCCAALSAA
jgi:hypothetical protein